MKRRAFINRILVSSGAVIAGSACSNTVKENNQAVAGPAEQGGFITEPGKQIPITDSVDVLVAGGGPSGVAAAITAARSGASTLLVERYNHLGGLWTGGLVLPLLATHAVNKNKQRVQTLYGVGNEINSRLKEMDMSISEVNPVVDPEAAKYIMEVMIKEAGVKMYYHSWASNVIKSGDEIKAVILETKSGRIAVSAKMVIDCTGDGDIMHHSGEDYEEMQFEIGLVHRLGNVDRINRDAAGFKKMDIGQPTPLKSVNWVNMTGTPHEDALDFKKLSQLQQEHRIAIWDQFLEMKKTPGYEEVFLLDTAPQQGVRMSRILNGMYKLSLDDSMNYKSFDDSIGISGAWISQLYNGKKVGTRERPLWQIPFRSLVPHKTPNLLVAGRCFSFEQDLFQDARVIGTCLVTGQGAGAGAAEAIRSGNAVQNLDSRKIQAILKEQDVLLTA